MYTILHVLDHSIPVQDGYSYRSLGIIRGQRARGWTTLHLTTPRHGPADNWPETVDDLAFYRVAAAGGPGFAPGLRELKEMRLTERALTRLCRERRPDLLHAHSPVLTALPALRVGRRLDLPVVYEVRALWEDAAAAEGAARPGGPRYRATRALETRVLRQADAVATICGGLRDEILSRGLAADKVTVVPNAVDFARFDRPAPRDAGLAAALGLGDGPVLGFIGSFYRYEGLPLLAEGFAALLRHRPEARLLLVGGGPDEPALRRRIEALGIAHAVVLPGRVPHAEIGRYYGLVDICVYPRLAERLTELVTPLKPLESMAQGKPVVASDVGGHRELIRDGETGLLFRAGDAEHLAAVVTRLLERRADWPALAARARRFVETERSWASSVARYEGIYARAAARHPRPAVRGAA